MLSMTSELIMHPMTLELAFVYLNQILVCPFSCKRALCGQAHCEVSCKLIAPCIQVLPSPLVMSSPKRTPPLHLFYKGYC